jgi:hypothetical protein
MLTDALTSSDDKGCWAVVVFDEEGWAVLVGWRGGTSAAIIRCPAKEIAMSKMPPVPPDNRSPKGPGSDPKTSTADVAPDDKDNLRERGRQGNIHQNTHNQGYQQDR